MLPVQQGRMEPVWEVYKKNQGPRVRTILIKVYKYRHCFVRPPVHHKILDSFIQNKALVLV